MVSKVSSTVPAIITKICLILGAIQSIYRSKIVVPISKSDNLDRDYVIRALSSVFGPQDWGVVHSPDSFNLR